MRHEAAKPLNDSKNKPATKSFFGTSQRKQKVRALRNIGCTKMPRNRTNGFNLTTSSRKQKVRALQLREQPATQRTFGYLAVKLPPSMTITTSETFEPVEQEIQPINEVIVNSEKKATMLFQDEQFQQIEQLVSSRKSGYCFRGKKKLLRICCPFL